MSLDVSLKHKTMAGYWFNGLDLIGNKDSQANQIRFHLRVLWLQFYTYIGLAVGVIKELILTFLTIFIGFAPPPSGINDRLGQMANWNTYDVSMAYDKNEAML